MYWLPAGNNGMLIVEGWTKHYFLLKEIGHCYLVLTLVPLTGQHLVLC